MQAHGEFMRACQLPLQSSRIAPAAALAMDQPVPAV
jgi:hypothetical protein